MLSTSKLASRQIAGLKHNAEGIEAVDFQYPYKSHSFQVGSRVLWYFRQAYSLHSVEMIAFRGKTIALQDENGLWLDVLECLNINACPRYLTLSHSLLL
jgi:hypothetical protein